MSLRIYTRANCPLCDRMERMVTPLLAAQGLTCDKQSIDASDELRRRFSLRIPVLARDDEVILEGRPSEEEARLAIAGLAPRGSDA